MKGRTLADQKKMKMGGITKMQAGGMSPRSVAPAKPAPIIPRPGPVRGLTPPKPPMMPTPPRGPARPPAGGMGDKLRALKNIGIGGIGGGAMSGPGSMPGPGGMRLQPLRKGGSTKKGRGYR